MSKESNSKTFITWLEEIWEEVEIQFFGIIGSLFFFFIVYEFFHPSWMTPAIDFLKDVKLSFLITH